jgi:peptidoglycan/xylan/chitin deacetylase (PgdA/CDA1 family)
MTEKSRLTVLGELDADELVTGKYEARRFPADFNAERRQPDWGTNILTQHGNLLEPVVDRARIERGDSKPVWPDNAEFAVCLTHDVDFVSSASVRHNLRDTIRTVRAQLKADDPGTQYPEMTVGPVAAMKRFVRGAGAIIQSALTRDDPLHCYERWLELESRYDATSTFFFMPDENTNPHATDNAYRYDDIIRFDSKECRVADFIRALDERGWEIGLHPTWYTFDNTAELNRQKRQIDNVLDHDVRTVRQHYLHYHPARTPRVHEAAGFEFDSTIGFNNHVGFRYGTSWPFQCYDIEADEQLSIVEVPLTAQDGPFFAPSALGADADLAFEYVQHLTENVRAVGGVLTLNWHPSTIANDRRFEFYERALSYLSDQPAWFGTIADIGDHWTA